MSGAPQARRELARFVALPLLLLTAGLLGGLRVEQGGRLAFLPPPLATLLMATLLMSLIVRAGLLRPGRWLSAELPALATVSHALTLLALFFASAQACHSVLPESGILHWVFTLFFLWTLWQDQFASFDAARLVRSLAALFGTAFVLKHLLLSSLHAPEGGLARRALGALLEAASLRGQDAPAVSPASGYVSFAALALYAGALALVRAAAPPAPPASVEPA